MCALMTVGRPSAVRAHTVTVDGSAADWAVIPATSPLASTTNYNMADVVGGEWVWKDALNDERRSTASPDNPDVDLTELRITADTANLYLLARYRRTALSATTTYVPPLLMVALEFDLGGGSGLNKFTDAANVSDAAFTASDVRWDRLISVYQRFGSATTTQVETGKVLVNSVSGGVATGAEIGGSAFARTLSPGATGVYEVAVPLSALGGSGSFLGKTVTVSAAVFQHKAAFEAAATSLGFVNPFDATGLNMMDALSIKDDSGTVKDGDGAAHGNGTAGTWEEVQDRMLDFRAGVELDLAGEVVARPPLTIPEAGLLVDAVQGNGDVVLDGTVPRFSWSVAALAGGSTAQTGFWLQVGTDADWTDTDGIAGGPAEMWDATAVSSFPFAAYGGAALQSGTTYFWRLRIADSSGRVTGWTPTQSFKAVTPAVVLGQGTETLEVDWNNPFYPSRGQVTKAHYRVTVVDKPVLVRVYTITGDLVRTLADQSALRDLVYTVTWDGKNDDGLDAASGIYLINLETADTKVTRKIVLIR